MPISKHFSGHGKEVMKSMKETYGPRAEQVFYATENSRKNKDSKVKSAMKRHMKGTEK